MTFGYNCAILCAGSQVGITHPLKTTKHEDTVMRPAIRDKFFELNGDWKGWVVKYIALPLIALGLLTGCASSRQIAPMTAVTRAHVVGTAATRDTVEQLTIKNGDTTRVVTIKSSTENAVAVDKALKMKELDSRTKVGTAQSDKKNAEMLARILLMGSQYYSGGVGIYPQGGSTDPRCRGECGTVKRYNERHEEE